MTKYEWCAGWNMPGCLPDDAPTDFETWEGARDSLIWELERLDCHGPEGEADAEAAIAELRSAVPGLAFCTAPVMGYVSWIAAAETPFEEEA